MRNTKSSVALQIGHSLGSCIVENVLLPFLNPTSLRSTTATQSFLHINSVSGVYFHRVRCHASMHAFRSQTVRLRTLVSLWICCGMLGSFVHIPKTKIELSIPHGFCQDPKDLYQNILKQYLVQSVQQMLTIFLLYPYITYTT